MAITCAPENPPQELIMALDPMVSIFAPIRFNSGTCINLFSNMFSLMTDELLDKDSSTIICACRSVGKPGNSRVSSSILLLISEILTLRLLSPLCILISKFSNTDSKFSI